MPLGKKDRMKPLHAVGCCAPGNERADSLVAAVPSQVPAIAIDRYRYARTIIRDSLLCLHPGANVGRGSPPTLDSM